MSNILLVRPNFPTTRNSVYNIPISLCKISAWKKSLGDTIYYVEGLISSEDLPFDKINEVYVTSMFTYWSQYVIDAINYYKKRCPNAVVYCGGIYASISPEHVKENSSVDKVIVGVIPEVEKFYPDYSILPKTSKKAVIVEDDILSGNNLMDINNTQIIWASRGCKRRCAWCYVWKIEPEIYFKEPNEVKKELITSKDRKNVLFYDNSLLQHPDLKLLLETLILWHDTYGFVYNCTQGIDGRMLKEWEEQKGVPVAKLMRKAGFYDLRFSYDHKAEKDSVYYCIDKFEKAGYKRNEMQIFVIINSNDIPEIVESRYWELYELGVQIHSDRYRPGDMFYDDFHKGGEDYFINKEHGWTNINIRGMLKFMSALNYANRMNVLYVEGDYIQNSKELNKGKSSKKLGEYL